jgi:hypothetical protein
MRGWALKLPTSAARCCLNTLGAPINKKLTTFVAMDKETNEAIFKCWGTSTVFDGVVRGDVMTISNLKVQDATAK